MSNKIKKMGKSNHPNNHVDDETERNHIDDETAIMIDQIGKDIEGHMNDVFYLYENDSAVFANEVNDLFESAELAADIIGEAIHLQLAKYIGSKNALLALNALIRATSAAGMARQLERLYNERIKNN